MTFCASIRKKALQFALLMVCSAMPALAQGQSPAFAPALEYIASVKPHTAGYDYPHVRVSKDSYIAEGATLSTLLYNAYTVREPYIAGLPGWAKSTRYDVSIKIIAADADALNHQTRETQKAMFVRVLEERFHLQAHTVVKTLPVMDLMIARNGPKLTLAGPAVPENIALGKMIFTYGKMQATSMRLLTLSRQLETMLNTTVIDKTGLDACYDFTLEWSQQATSMSDSAASDDGVSIFTALQEQLGLKLVSDKGPVTTLVVDHVEPPTQN